MSRPVWIDDELTVRLWQQLCVFADWKMDCRLRRREGPEDPVQSAFRTFFRRVDDGQYASLQGPGELLALLRTITYRKLLKHKAYHTAKIRNPDREEYGKEDTLPNRSQTKREKVLADELKVKVLEGSEMSSLAFQMDVFEGLLKGHSQRKISRELGCTRDAVSRCVKQFRVQVECLLDEVVADTSVDRLSA